MLKSNKMADRMGIGLILCVFLPVALADYTCYEKRWFNSDRVFYCSNGCCGDDYNKYCCWENVDLTGAAIAGIVIGCVVLIAIIVGSIIACYCCLRKRRSQQGQVVSTGGMTTTTTVAYPGAYPMQLQAPYGQPQQMGYTTTGYPQPPNTNVDPPAYTK